MRITDFNFFKFLKQSDIVHLINYVEDNRFLIEEEKIDEIKFLYEFFRIKYGEEFNPITVLKYIYMFMPKKYVGLSTLRLSLTQQEMQKYVVRYKEVYDVKIIGEGNLFDDIGELKSFRQIKTRQDVWVEIINTNVFLEAYRFWQPSWVERRAIFSCETKGATFLIALRKVGYKIIVSEVQSVNNSSVDISVVNRIQELVNAATKKSKKSKELERVLI